MNLDSRSRQAFHTYLKHLVADTIRREPGGQFAAIPAATDGWLIDDKVYAAFINLVVSKSAFLGRVRQETGLDRLQGNIFRDDIAGHVLKRTNVSDTVKRGPTITGSATPELFNLLRAEFDYLLDYDRLRHWAHLGEDVLANRVRDQIAVKFANDIQWVAFQGISDGNPPAAADLTDFAKGWLQLLRDYAAGAQVMQEVVAGSGIITLGPKKVMQIEGAVSDEGGGKVGFPVTAHGRPAGSQVVVNGTTNYDGAYLVDPASTANKIVVTAAYVVEDATGKTITHTPDYQSLDALVADLRNGIEPELRINLTALVAENLRAADEEAIYGEIGRTPTEKVAVARAMAELAGLERLSPYGLPDGLVMVTDPMNLAIYWHQEFHRRVEDTPENNGFTFWNDTNLDFIITDYRRAFAAENVTITS